MPTPLDKGKPMTAVIIPFPGEYRHPLKDKEEPRINILAPGRHNRGWPKYSPERLNEDGTSRKRD